MLRKWWKVVNDLTNLFNTLMALSEGGLAIFFIIVLLLFGGVVWFLNSDRNLRKMQEQHQHELRLIQQTALEEEKAAWRRLASEQVKTLTIINQGLHDTDSKVDEIPGRVIKVLQDRLEEDNSYLLGLFTKKVLAPLVKEIEKLPERLREEFQNLIRNEFNEFLVKLEEIETKSKKESNGDD